MVLFPALVGLSKCHLHCYKGLNPWDAGIRLDGFRGLSWLGEPVVDYQDQRESRLVCSRPQRSDLTAIEE